MNRLVHPTASPDGIHGPYRTTRPSALRKAIRACRLGDVMTSMGLYRPPFGPGNFSRQQPCAPIMVKLSPRGTHLPVWKNRLGETGQSLCSLVLAALFVVLGFCWSSTSAHADMSSFVADAVQAAPGQEQRRGKLYVSELGTRFEFTARNQKTIQIIQPAKGLFWLLFPKTKTYYEIKSAPFGVTHGRRARAPCEPSAQTECFREGLVDLTDKSIERWIVGDKISKQRVKVWWDPVRRMYIRQQFPDGRMMVARMTGTRTFEGRKVEQWQMVVTLTNKVKLYSYMLYAPDLGFPVMEQGVTGLIKELHNIKAITVDAALYKIPAGYRKIPLPVNLPK